MPSFRFKPATTPLVAGTPKNKKKTNKKPKSPQNQNIRKLFQSKNKQKIKTQRKPNFDIVTREELNELNFVAPESDRQG